MQKCKLSPLAMGLSIGVLWGLSVFFTGLAAYYFSYGKPFVIAMSAMYIGYEPSISGSFIGALFGFFDGLIGGAVLAALYNFFSCSHKCCGAMKDTSCDKKTH